MATEEYVVGARLELHAPTVLRSLQTVSDRMTALGAKISGTNSMFRNMLGSAIAFGGAYVGVRAVGNAITNVATEGFRANAEMEVLRLSLASIYGAVENKSLTQSLGEVAGLFDRIALAAAESPATQTELIGIMNQIYGPLSAAGMSQERLLTLMQSTSAASMALGISNDVAASSLSRMAQGSAGMENPLFRALKSMRLITESTEEFNKLSAPERAERLERAINRIGGESAAAFGETWVGVSSTFEDLMGMFKRTFAGGAFNVIKGSLASVNEGLLRYRENITRVMEAAGSKIGEVLSRVFQYGKGVFEDVVANLDRTAARMDAMIARFMEIKPVLQEAAKVFLAMQIARGVVGPLLSLMGTVGSALATIGGLMGAGAGAAAGAAGAGGAAAAGGVGAATLTAIGTAAAAIAAPLALIAAAGAAVYLGFQQFGAYLMPMVSSLSDTFSGIGSDFMAIISDVWAFIGPPLSMLGGILGGAVLTAFRMLGGVIRVAMLPLRMFGRVLKWAGDFLRPVFQMIGEMMLTLFDKFGELGDAFSRFAAWVSGGAAPAGGSGNGTGPGAAALAAIRAAWNGSGSSPAASASTPSNAPATRGGTTVNMQGARITVNQEFREADPDRVWIAMRDALEREAVQRTQSGFANALTR